MYRKSPHKFKGQKEANTKKKAGIKKIQRSKELCKEFNKAFEMTISDHSLD